MLFPFSPSPARATLTVAVTVLAAALPTAVRAAEPFEIQDIRVEGLQRTDPGTVFAALPFRVGDGYSDEKGAAALRALFATGLFKDVRLDIDGRVLVVIIEERPVIQAVTFTGLKEFDKEPLQKSLKDAGIGEGLPFDKALVDRAEQEIKRQYLSRSLYGAEVVTTITPTERNRVNVNFAVTEGDAARIKDVRILGVKAFSEGTLVSLMEMSATGWMSWYNKNDRYSRAKLNADLEAIRSYYLNRGYLEFAIESTQVTMTPDKQEIAISITVKEGQPYTVTGVKLEGEFLGKDEEFRELVTIRPGEAYRAQDVESTTKAFSDRFGMYGYAFPHIEPLPQIDRANGQVGVVLRVDPGRRYYVRRVDVAGNTKTRDEVVRREFRQFESSWYDGAKIKLSRERLDRLGYFKEVSVETNEVPNSPDQVDLVVNVTEKPTGNLMLGVSFSSTDRFALSASIKQDNIFGSGNYLGAEVNTGRTARSLVLTTADPYFTIDGVSRSIELAYRTSRPLYSNALTTQVSDAYSIATPSASIRFGVPFSEYDTVFFGVGVERTTIAGELYLPQAYYYYRDKYGSSSSAMPLTLGWSRDSRDSVIAPTSGRYQRVNLDWSVLGDVRYLRSNLQFQQYLRLGRQFSLGFNAELGYGKGLGDRAYPFFKNFYGGGQGSVRVFEQGSFGTIDPTGAYIGGAKKFNFNTELYVPLPGTGNDKSLRVFGFFDTGYVWPDNEKIKASDLRASAGIGLSWISPVGPLKMSYGSPVRSKAGDKIQHFQFQIGTSF